MGSLNTFYLMGRVARAAEPVGQRHGHPVVVFGLSTSAQGREPVMLEASGPQAEQARHLRMGQGVFVRGLLRVDAGESGRPTLVAQVQALDAVIDGARLRPRPPREGDGAGAGASVEGQPDEDAGTEGAEGAPVGEGGEGDPGASGSRRRPRRRRGRRRPEGARPGAEGAAPEGAPAGEGAPQEPPRPTRPELPPPAPIAAPPQPVQPKPDPTYRSDMPF